MIKNIIIASLIIIVVGAVGVGIYDVYQGNSSLEMPNFRALAAGQMSLEQGQTQMEQGQMPGAGQMGRGQMGQHGGQGQMGQGAGNGSGEPIQHDWLTLSGTVVEVQPQGLLVDTTERGELLLNLGRIDFADQQGVVFNPGDVVTINGFDSPQSQFVAGDITNVTTGQTLLLRDPNGRPLWAGPGRQQNGNGQGQGAGRGRGQGRGQGQGRGPGQGWNQ